MAKKRGGLAGFYDRNKKVINTVAPIALGLIPGVGPMLAAGYGTAAGGFDRPGQSGISFDPAKGVIGGISGYGMGKLGHGAGALFDGAKAPMLGGVGSGTSNVANAGVPGSLGGVVKSEIGSLLPTSVGDAARKIGGLVPKVLNAAGGGQGAGMGALAIAQGVNAANLSRQSTDKANQAIDLLTQNYADRAPLRTQGMAGMLTPHPVDTSGLSAMRVNSGNPFARPLALGR